MLDVRTHVVVESHLAHMRLAEFSEATVYSRYRALTRMAAHFPGTSLLDLDSDDLMAWRMDIAHLTPDAVVHYVSHAHAFYEWAIDYGHVTADPSAKLPTPRLARRLPRPISEDDLDEAVRQAPDRVRPWLVLAGWAGLRAKEIALLDRSNVLDTARPPVITRASPRRGRPPPSATSTSTAT